MRQFLSSASEQEKSEKILWWGLGGLGQVVERRKRRRGVEIVPGWGDSERKAFALMRPFLQWRQCPSCPAPLLTLLLPPPFLAHSTICKIEIRPRQKIYHQHQVFPKVQQVFPKGVYFYLQGARLHCQEVCYTSTKWDIFPRVIFDTQVCDNSSCPKPYL